MNPDLLDLTRRLRAFADAREWEQFHSPKNLAMAVSAEAGELLEHFLWLTEQQSRELPTQSQLDEVRQEIADVFLYLLMLADKLDVDLIQAAREKIELNEQRYPADKARGNSRKYDQL